MVTRRTMLPAMTAMLLAALRNCILASIEPIRIHKVPVRRSAHVIDGDVTLPRYLVHRRVDIIIHLGRGERLASAGESDEAHGARPARGERRRDADRTDRRHLHTPCGGGVLDDDVHFKSMPFGQFVRDERDGTRRRIAAHRTLGRVETEKRRFSENPCCRNITVMLYYLPQAQNWTRREAQKLTGWHSSERQETRDVRSQTRQSA